MPTTNFKLYRLAFFLFLNILASNQSIIAQRRINIKNSESIPLTSIPANTSTCSSASNAYFRKYSQQSFYIPTENDKVITFKITIHIFKPIADTGRWQMNDNNFNGLPALKYMLDSITNGHQERYSLKRNATYDVIKFNSSYIYDSKIKFEITNIYFYPEPELYSLNNDETLFRYIEKTDSNRISEGMPIVFNASSGPGHLSSYKGSAALVTTIHAYDLVFGRSHLIHEIGHGFGLGHTYVNTSGGGSDWQNFHADCGSPDYLSDVFPNNNPNCSPYKSIPTNSPCLSCYEASPDTSNNLMGGQRYNRWISPLQMGRRIRSLHLNSNIGENIRHFAKETESDHDNVWKISSNEIWDFDIQLYKDVLVKENVTLNITCKVAMALEGKIKLEKNAHLIIDGGEITCWCKSGTWQGVEITRVKKKKKDDKTITPELIKLLNGGFISKSKTPLPIN
ncbi:MAG: hypothetical protein WCH21_05410 [Bacteroidota bacterium]